jgi:hypothetical protein
MKTRILLFLALLSAPFASGAVNARNGISITTASTINGVTPNSAINGQTITAAPASGITFAAANTATGGTSIATGRTESITIPTLTDGYIVFWTTWFDGTINNLTGVTFDGVAMAVIGTGSNGPDNSQVRIYGLQVAGKTAGSYDAVISFSGGGSIDIYTGGIVAYNGVNQILAASTPGSNTGSGTTATVNISSDTGELVVSVLYADDDGTIAVGADQTERNKNTGSGIGGALSDEAGVVAPGDTVASFTKGNSSVWVIAAVPLFPAP